MKKILLLLLALIASVNVWAEDYITDVMVIGGSKSVVNDLKDTYTGSGLDGHRPGPERRCWLKQRLHLPALQVGK